VGKHAGLIDRFSDKSDRLFWGLNPHPRCQRSPAPKAMSWDVSPMLLLLHLGLPASNHQPEASRRRGVVSRGVSFTYADMSLEMVNGILGMRANNALGYVAGVPWITLSSLPGEYVGEPSAYQVQVMRCGIGGASARAV
jgi:hypothetical protein